MNKENLDRLIAEMSAQPESNVDLEVYLQTEGEYFDLVSLLDSQRITLAERRPVCGTVGCIAGYCAILAKPEDVVGEGSYINYLATGEKFLGIGTYEASDLFDGLDVDYETGMTHKAAALLRLAFLKDMGYYSHSEYIVSLLRLTNS